MTILTKEILINVTKVSIIVIVVIVITSSTYVVKEQT
jgi:hypothetical protein